MGFTPQMTYTQQCVSNNWLSSRYLDVSHYLAHILHQYLSMSEYVKMHSQFSPSQQSWEEPFLFLLTFHEGIISAFTVNCYVVTHFKSCFYCHNKCLVDVYTLVKMYLSGSCIHLKSGTPTKQCLPKSFFPLFNFKKGFSEFCCYYNNIIIHVNLMMVKSNNN